MASIYDLKPKFQNLLRPITRALAGAGVTANQVTVAALVPGFEPVLVVAAVLLAVFTEMAGVVCVQIGASRRYDGPFGKSDRAFVFGALGLLLGFGVPGGLWVSIVLGAMILLLAVTIFNRARKGLTELGGGSARR